MNNGNEGTFYGYSYGLNRDWLGIILPRRCGSRTMPTRACRPSLAWIDDICWTKEGSTTAPPRADLATLRRSPAGSAERVGQPSHVEAPLLHRSAIANKNARVMWVVPNGEESYRELRCRRPPSALHMKVSIRSGWHRAAVAMYGHASDLSPPRWPRGNQ